MFLLEEATLGTGGIIGLVAGVVGPLVGLVGLMVRWIVTRLSKSLDRFSESLERLAGESNRAGNQGERLACSMDETTGELRRLSDRLGDQVACPWTPVSVHEVTTFTQVQRRI